MIIDVTRIDDGATRFDLDVAAANIKLDTPNYRLLGTIKAEGEVLKHIASVTVNGTVRGSAEIDCTRCAQLIEKALEIDFDVEYLTEGRLGSEGEHEISESDLGADELLGNDLDLVELIREQIILNIPEQFFCRDDCKGLCEICGGNLNLVDCKCWEGEIDPRWDALKDLKDKY